MMAKKAAPIYTPEDIYRFVDLGLGRGIDATNPTPWLNKTSFQVRRVHKENILGTEEGGAQQSYDREVSSVQKQQATMKFAITVPQSPVIIGSDAELSRSISTNRRVIGKRVLNRTISFKDDFVDVPLSGAKALPKPNLGATEENAGIGDAQQSLLTFEERLASWLVQQISAHRESTDVLKESDDEPSDSDKAVASAAANLKQEKVCPLEALAQIIHCGRKEELKLLVRTCRDFVEHFRITHYVTSIELGAAEYRVLTEQEYFSKVGFGGSFGLEKVVSSVISGRASSRKMNKASDLRKIGKIVDDTVERGSYDEAVVGVKIKPITSLVRLQFLQLALKKALVNFLETEGDTSDGPFIISCADDHVYLSVDLEHHSLIATRDLKQALPFYIIPTDDGESQYEFLIVHYDDTGIAKHLHRSSSSLSKPSVINLQPMGRYLAAPLSTFGRNPGPLFFRSSVSQNQCCFALHHRLSRHRRHPTVVDLTTWTLSRDVFFINCSRRKFRRDGYLCVKEGLESGSLSVSCVPSLKEHNDLDTFMLFRLLPSSVSTQGHDSPTSKTAVKEINLNKDEEDEVEAAERRRKETARVFTATVDFHTDRCVEQPSLTALSD